MEKVNVIHRKPQHEALFTTVSYMKNKIPKAQFLSNLITERRKRKWYFIIIYYQCTTHIFFLQNFAMNVLFSFKYIFNLLFMQQKYFYTMLNYQLKICIIVQDLIVTNAQQASVIYLAVFRILLFPNRNFSLPIFLGYLMTKFCFK